jgi:membrane protein
VRQAVSASGEDRIPLLAAGVAFYGFLSLVPTLVAATLLYGLVTDPLEVQRQAESLAEVLPASAQDLVSEQMLALAGAPSRDLGIGLVLSLTLALWSASGGTGHLLGAVGMANDGEPTHNLVVRRLLALAVTLVGILFFALTLSLVAVFPAVAHHLDLPASARVVAEVVRWVVLLAVTAMALGVVYRLAPGPADRRRAWRSPGAVVATLLWVLATGGFSLYVDTFAGFGRTYGSLAGVVVLLLWLWISSAVVLFGAELDTAVRAERER